MLIEQSELGREKSGRGTGLYEAESTAQTTAFPTASESLSYRNSVRCMHLDSQIIIQNRYVET